MNLRARVELLILGAIWGASFLFMRVAAPEFGPIALIQVRVAIAAFFLTSVLAWRRGTGAFRRRWPALALLGAVNSAIPFSLFAFGTLSLTAGLASVLNATAPLFGALIAFLWLRERLAPAKWLGLTVGFAGVILLVWHKLSLIGDRSAVLACLAAAAAYGWASHFAKRRLGGVDPLAIAAGSQIGASLVLAPFAWASWPQRWPSATSWACALALGVLCTGVAYVLYFRSLAQLGPVRAITVTYLIPVFGVLWGGCFLDEPITARTILGAAVILTGTYMVLRSGSPAASASGSAAPQSSDTSCLNSPTRAAP
jgi:drug/metabolite transporter (DMT)-like permease